MNKVILVGNLTRDPELTETPNGVSVCKFDLAVNRDYTGADGERDCDFFHCTVWRGRAESCGKYLKKGSKVAVVGSLENRSYEDKDGIKRYVTDVVASEVEFLTPLGNSEPREVPGAGKYDKPEESSEVEKPTKKSQLKEVDDDLPFN
jgi:single-strand DNA-binding protein